MDLPVSLVCLRHLLCAISRAVIIGMRDIQSQQTRPPVRLLEDHEFLSDIDVHVHAIVDIDRRASRPAQKHGLDKRSVGDGRMGRAERSHEPSCLAAVVDIHDKVFDNVEVRATKEDGVLL